MKYFLTLLCCMGLFSFLFGQDFPAYEKRVFEDGKGGTLNYRILYPAKYKPNKKYPLVLFLHGAGERGGDNEKQLTHGGKLFLDKKNRKKYPAIVVFPQCPQDDYWAHMLENRKDGLRLREFPEMPEPRKALGQVMQLLEKLVKEESVDPDRVYVMGLSMGGMGTFEILSRMPERFAAAIPICGGGNPTLVDRYAKNTSLWIFHGLKDDVVLPRYSEQMHEAIKAAGGDVRYTAFPEANHNSWDPTFAEPDLLKWLFSHK